MSVRVTIDDYSAEICVYLSASGNYAPDVVDDLRARAVQTYREALVNKLAVSLGAETTGEGDE